MASRLSDGRNEHDQTRDGITDIEARSGKPLSQRKAVTHELKTDIDPFLAVWSGMKKAEIRINDRDFREGDALLLKETRYTAREMRTEKKPLIYTNRQVLVMVTHIQPVIKLFGQDVSLVMLSFEIAQRYNE